MPIAPKFNDVNWLSGASVDVTGEFATHESVIDYVFIRILVIPDGTDPAVPSPALTKPMVGDAKVSTFTTTGSIQTGTFSGQVNAPSNPGYTVARGERVRVIGIAVAIKAPETAVAPEPQDPPGFETFTWCVGRTIT